MRDVWFVRIVVFMVMALMILVASCNKPTAAKNGIVQGNIYLDGLADHSGVTVLLYVDNIVNQELKTINQDYPNLAFTIESKHLFDHRLQTPLATTFTDSQGYYSFSDVAYGSYIIAYFKEGWGYKYIFDINLTQSVINFEPTDENMLHPIITIPPSVLGDFTFETGFCYVAESSVDFLPGSSVVMNPGCRILLPASERMSLWGSLMINENGADFIEISSSDKMYSYASTPAKMDKFEISMGANLTKLSMLKLSHSTNGLILKQSNVNIENSIFHDNTISCQMFTISIVC